MRSPSANIPFPHQPTAVLCRQTRHLRSAMCHSNTSIMRHILLFALFLCCKDAAFGQNFHISEPYSTRNHLGYEIMGKVGDSYLLFRDKGDEFDVMSYNGGMVNTWVRELDIPTRNTKILSVLPSENDFSIFYKTRLKGSGEYLLGIRKFDPGAQLIDTLTIKNYGSAYDNQPSFTTIVSENKQMIAFVNDAHDDRLEIICFQADQMRILWEKSWFLDLDRAGRKIPGFLLSNEGALYLITDENNKRSKLEEHQLRISILSQSKDELHTIPLQAAMTVDIAYALDQKNQKLVAAGLYSDKNPEKSLGHLLARFDLKDKTQKVEYTPFDDQMAGIMAGKDATDASKGIMHLQARRILVRMDGGVVFVCERQHYIERGMTSARGGFWRDVPRRIVDYFYDDMVIITTQPDGKVQWRTVLHKKQYSQDDEGIYSSFFMMLEPTQVRLIFNDEIMNENTCSAYRISPNGTYTRESLLNTEDRQLRLRFRDATQINTRELLIPSEHNNRLQLVRVEF
jgi:hypothetical protein